jgi:hypothetical protein
MTGKGSEAAGWPGIDIIGNGYVVAEPTPGYMWLDGQSPFDGAEPPMPPQWLIDGVLRYTRKVDSTSPAHRGAERAPRSDRLTNNPEELAIFRDALAHITPDCGRDDWISVGMAINAKSGGSVAGFDLWDEWSRGPDDAPAASYDAKTIYRQWASFDPWSSIQAGTLFAVAERHGWDKAGSRQRVAIAHAQETDPVWAALFEQALRELSEHSTAGAGMVKPGAVETALDLLGEEFGPVAWLVDELITPASVCMIAGEPKTAKTWAGIEILVSLLTGSKVFGKFKARHVEKPVFAFLAEDQRRSLRNRVRSIASGKGIDPRPWAGRFLFQSLQPLNLLNDQHCAKLIADIRRRAPDGIACLYLDPLRNLHHGEENSSTEMTPVWDRLRALRTVLGCPVIVTHHMGKSGGGGQRRGGQRARGSNATHGAIDVGLYLDDLKKDSSDKWTQRVESEVKAAKPAESFKLELTLTDDASGEATHAHWAVLSDADTPMGARVERWIEHRAAFQGGAPFGTADLAEELQISEKSARNAISTLRKSGYLTQIKSGLYAPNEGAE